MIVWGSPRTSTPICNFIPDVFFLRHTLFLQQYQHFECFWSPQWSLSSVPYAHFSLVRLQPACVKLGQGYWHHFHLVLPICHNGSAHFAILENHVECFAMCSLPLTDTKLRKICHINHISLDVFSFFLCQLLAYFFKLFLADITWIACSHFLRPPLIPYYATWENDWIDTKQALTVLMCQKSPERSGGQRWHNR